ncbi:MAG: LysE family transporter [Nitrososphaeria archaeon]|jgi:threonine/homoserine/homoserine lactone efflux protein
MFDLSVLLKIIIVSASGALVPGPLTASATTLGVKNGWKAGLRIAFGHTLVEFPLVISIAYGLETIFQIPSIKFFLGLVGGSFLLFFGCLTVKDALYVRSSDFQNTKSKHNSSLFVGVILTLFNPYFIAWWLGVGSTLMMQVLTSISLFVVIVFYLAHVWLDYVWLMFISTVGSASKINLKLYKIILIVLSIIIFYFGINLITSTIF